VRGAAFIQGGYRLDFYFLPLGRIALIQEAPGQLLDIFWTASGELWTLPIQYDKLVFLDCNMRFACTIFISLEWMSRINVPKSSFYLLLSPQTNRITNQFQKNHVVGATFIQGGYRLDFYFLPLGRIALIQEAPGQLLDIFWTTSGQLWTLRTTSGQLWTLPIQYDKLVFLDCNMRFACTFFISLEWMSRINVPKSRFDLLLSPQTKRITIQFHFFHVRGATCIQGGYRLDLYFLPLGRIALIQKLLDNSWTTPGQLLDTANST
jgi:hypothetical protein